MLILEFMAVAVSAVYGSLMAARARMDFVGSFTIAFLAALGGGSLRDLILDRHPLFWIGQPYYPITVFIICIIVPFLIKFISRIKPILLYPDSLGMALFTVVGTKIALDAQDSNFIAVLLGTITGTFGGVLADIVCNEVPSLFRPAPLCATCAFCGAWIYVFGAMLCWEGPLLISVSVIFIVIFRIAAVVFDWRFPSVRQPD
ncbi:trimeric intracellular cation channel family protein [Verrucomicrobiaceae bacterium N1E253]|uniref:Trimeric intracellular cation channel family protein n=1 Tax=Oceaniferula marina TaxID=2748318 RepID=A0A851GAU3_9BACT|nr:trimeric intracellular cation channel family protein [Oceaniferula marina]NWK54309.1 trimeric intracellular cation channel family protein [Oceaniferula marina]